MKNPFESGARVLIPAVLVYGERENGDLLFHYRCPDLPKNKGSTHAGKWNGLGGKLELDESFQDAARREFHEESGLLLVRDLFSVRGFLHFPEFQEKKNQDWFVQVFKVRIPQELESKLISKSEEGELRWIPPAEVLKLNLWEGDPHFLKPFLEGKRFQGTLWYREGNLTRTEIMLLT